MLAKIYGFDEIKEIIKTKFDTSQQMTIEFYESTCSVIINKLQKLEHRECEWNLSGKIDIVEVTMTISWEGNQWKIKSAQTFICKVEYQKKSNQPNERLLETIRLLSGKLIEYEDIIIDKTNQIEQLKQ